MTIDLSRYGHTPFADGGAGRKTGARTQTRSDGEIASDDEALSQGDPRSADARLRELTASFRVSLRQAHDRDEGAGDNGKDKDKDDAGAGALLLAEAGPAPQFPAPDLSAAAPARRAPPAWAAPIVAQIETNVRRQLAEARAGAALRLRIPLDPASEHVRSLELAITATTLDVRLQRGAGVDAQLLALAAQDLAGRLAVRFPGKIVRVHETPGEEAEPVAAGDGLGVIAQMLSGRGETP